ncbi:MAG TPA: hypothetical protein VJ044_03180, partial [Candidatus Hodarchaeales archaeon]|nr:hypothetical protein [Candidatus Hodarchaeales archaeon]
SLIKDVFADPNGNPNLNLDSLIVKYAGENGIPPQLVKGQIEQESSFRPAWRYEPMKDLDYQTRFKERFFADGLPFVKTTTHALGTGDLPSNHSYVSPEQYDYSDPPKTIGGYFAANWSKYRKRGKNGEPDSILASAELTRRFKELYKAPAKLNRVNIENAKQSAYNELGKELLAGKTLLAQQYHRIAQTRTVTSYGVVQLMYTMTIDKGGTFNAETGDRYALTGTQYMDKLDEHEFPEKLNEHGTTMPIYSDRLLRNLNLILAGARIPPSQWTGSRVTTHHDGTKITKTFDGFEANWKASLYYFNPGGNYGNEVVQKSQAYLPH